jgi:nucleotide-binding universal stress UspA family protein
VLRTIVVPLDGSRFAETAVAPAAEVARKAGARLHLVMVHEPILALVPAADVPAPAAPDDVELRQQEQAYLTETAERLGTVGSGPVKLELVDGMAGPALTDYVAKVRPDLVIMSTHGRGPLSRFWLGSVADHLIRHASVPLLLLRPKDGQEPQPEELALRSALVPLDLSDEAETVVPVLRDLIRLTGGEITLLHVVEPILGISGAVPPYPVAVPADQLEYSREEAQKRLDGVAARLRTDGLTVSSRVVVGLGVAGTVLETLEQSHLDFVAMSTHGAGGFKRLLVGSVADKVIRASSRPVLVYRPPAKA